MKKLLLLFFLAFNAAQAQVTSFCASTERHLQWFRQHPELEKQFFSRRAENAGELNARKASSSTEYTIPVVFHILHKGTMANISDNQIKDAIRILNRDFNKQNADTINVVPAFQGKVANVGIHFALAQLDPYGNCTNGINRHEVTDLMFPGDQADFQYSWPRDNYLNIYVVGALPAYMNAAAYAYMPGMGVPPEMDAIVALQQYVGSVGTSDLTKSRVLTHEVGHWLGLDHVWGWNDVGTYCGDDYIWDTPETKGFTSCDTAHASICNPPIVENVQNYMDYSYCNKMFTNGQADWMIYTLNTYLERSTLSTYGNLYTTGLVQIEDHCKTELEIDPFPYVSACIGNTITVNTHTSVAPASSFVWTADNGAVVLSPNSAKTGVVITNTGVTSLSCKATNNAGSTTKYLNIGGLSPNDKIVSPHKESFEQLNIPDTWYAYSDNNEYWWYVYTGASYEGYKSVYLKGEDLQPGSRNYLVSPAYDLSDKGDTLFSFVYAYARSSGYHQDVFKVQGSADCGTTWTDIYTPYAGQFANMSAGIKASPFVPEDKHWKKIELGSMKGFKTLSGHSNVRFRFYFREDTAGVEPGNRLYLDAINFSTVTGLQKNTADPTFKVFPQPAAGEFYVRFTSPGAECEYTIESVDGKVVAQHYLGSVPAGEQQITVGPCPAPGLYLLRLKAGKRVTVSKLVAE